MAVARQDVSRGPHGRIKVLYKKGHAEAQEETHRCGHQYVGLRPWKGGEKRRFCRFHDLNGGQRAIAGHAGFV